MKWSYEKNHVSNGEEMRKDRSEQIGERKFKVDSHERLWQRPENLSIYILGFALMTTRVAAHIGSRAIIAV